MVSKPILTNTDIPKKKNKQTKKRSTNSTNMI